MDAPASDKSLLRAVIDRIIPRDADPGALDLGTDVFVRWHLADEAGDRELIEAGIEALGQRGFEQLSAEAQDELLQALETAPWFVRLVTLTAEGFYADPDNAGNSGAGSWEMIGYRHGLPEGPSGPPGASGFSR